MRLWAVEQLSCRNPGSVNSSVLVSPPIPSRASRTRHRNPARDRYAAATKLLCPAPATTTSYSALIASSPAEVQEPLGVAAEHGGLLRREQPELPHIVDWSDRAHVEGVVRAEQHVVGSGVRDEGPQQLRIVRDGVVVESSQRAVR